MYFHKSILVVAAICSALVVGCSGSSEVKDDLNLKGKAPEVLTPDPNMKAPEDRGGGKGSGADVGQG